MSTDSAASSGWPPSQGQSLDSPEGVQSDAGPVGHDRDAGHPASELVSRQDEADSFALSEAARPETTPEIVSPATLDPEKMASEEVALEKPDSENLDVESDLDTELARAREDLSAKDSPGPASEDSATVSAAHQNRIVTETVEPASTQRISQALDPTPESPRTESPRADSSGTDSSGTESLAGTGSPAADSSGTGFPAAGPRRSDPARPASADPWPTSVSRHAEAEHFVEQTSFVRPYALTGGRTKANYQLELETLVSARNTGGEQPSGKQPSGKQPSGEQQRAAEEKIEFSEYQSIVEQCRTPRSVAELVSALRVPLGVARVLISDAADAGVVVVHRTVTRNDSMEAHLMLMERVLSGLRRL